MRRERVSSVERRGASQCRHGSTALNEWADGALLTRRDCNDTVTQMSDHDTIGKSALLRAGLAGNAVFSFVTGAGMLVAPATIADAIGLGWPHAVRVIGAGLMIFCVILARLAVRRRPNRLLSTLCTVADGVWVAGTAFLWVAAPGLLSGRGWVVAGLVAAVVAVFALVQGVGLKGVPHGRS